MVERGVEAGDLLQTRACLGHRMDRRQAVRHVERVERRQRHQLGQQLRCDQGGCDVVRPAMHDAMAHGRQPVPAEMGFGEGQQGVQRGRERVGQPGRQLRVQQDRLGRIVGEQAWRCGEFGDFATGGSRPRSMRAEEGEFQARGTGIYRQDESGHVQPTPEARRR